ncbi:hypothetical protein [Hymenobacter ruricola]|uniref:Right-handed parallel beta-helix repeat-containing protein n=1 Tax=Hymenobacter ruricola TaxID=2791023 RepID=A0ABS0I770_9BACT|nr:hypothetical protein [Hymenobacter ruricola]MBF9222795.1 hypothetical protein [Hymenobacter ruricola]
MKNLSASLLFVLLALAAQLASAQTIRRVNNNGVTGTNIYSTVQLAHDAAATGDIIQLEPSTVSYGSLTCTKQLSIVGPGYFLSNNQPPALQASVIAAQVDNVYFTTGSAGASLAGVTVNSSVFLGANNLSVQRNYVGSYIYFGYSAASNNALVRQNYVTFLAQYSTAGSNLLITNNIVTLDVSLNAGNLNGEFSNNVVLRYSSFDNFTVKNNYLASNFTPTANTTWRYNLLGSSSLPATGSQSNNTANVPQATVFVLGPGSTQFDAWYKLKTGTNPATGGGEGGVDVGAFGSATGYAYKLSGIPAIPAIYQLNQSVTGNTLNVNLSTRSNN